MDIPKITIGVEGRSVGRHLNAKKLGDAMRYREKFVFLAAVMGACTMASATAATHCDHTCLANTLWPAAGLKDTEISFFRLPQPGVRSR